MQPKGFLVGIGEGDIFLGVLILAANFCLGAYFRREGIFSLVFFLVGIFPGTFFPRDIFLGTFYLGLSSREHVSAGLFS